jgi:PAT family beta-lactamase induction signal transducer AmpG
MSVPSGWLADHMSWFAFWASTGLMAIPGLLLLVWITRLYPDDRHLVPGAKTAEDKDADVFA